ncbi:MAG TPA: WD40 repeat domain-containing protein, partial [Kofleriaceae bacterium]|nr:WD40 repeat domain-containing protein [Kofleriaceae bacterium]
STKAYDAIGGVTGALARHADETVDAMPASERQLARKAFRHLVTFEGTRAVLEREELHQLLGETADAGRLIERLVEARLLVSSENDRGAGVVEIVHEALIREWPRLVEWRREDIEGSRFHEQLRAAARQWQDRGRPRGLLWRGDALAEYRLWRRRHAASLTPLEAAFGAASVTDAARGRRIRQVIAAAAIAVVAVFFVALWRASLAANRAKLEAEGLLRDSYFEQGRLRVLEGDRFGALAPLATAYRRGRTDAPTRLLLEAAVYPSRARLLTLAGHTDKLWDVAYSPDGRWLASASADRTARIWNAETGALRATITHADRVITVAWSPDSRLVASGSSDRTVRVWDVIAGHEVAALPVGESSRWVAFSPDGSVLLTAATQRTVKLWRLPGGAPAGELAGHGHIMGASFCESGDCIATWDTGRIVLWDAATLAPRATHQANGVLWSAAVSRTGGLLAIGTRAGELVLLRGDGTVIARRAAHDDQIFDIAISPDETLVATASDDRTARLWSAAGEPRGVLAGHRANITRVRFTPAGDRVVTASADNTARLWSASGMLLGELTGHTNVIMMAALRPDGGRLATASWDHTVRVWDLARAEELRLIVGARDPRPAVVAFDPGGGRLAVARAGGTLTVADAGTGAVACTAPGATPIQALVWTGPEELAAVRRGGRSIELWDLRRCAVAATLDHPVSITGMSTQAGPRLATEAGGVVRIWDRGRLAATLTGHTGQVEVVGIDGGDVYATTSGPATVVVDALDGDPARRRIFRGATRSINHVRFDRARGQLLAASDDQFVYVWDAATGALLRKLEGTGPLWAVRTSPDGAIAVGVGGFSPTVWDRTTGARLGQLDGHSALVRHGEFLDDRIFVSAASNRTALVWDLDATQPLMQLHDVDAVVLSEDRRAVALVGTAGVRVWSPRAPAPAPDALRADGLK